MWQVTYNLSVVGVPSSGGNVSSSEFKSNGDGTRIQAPLLADRCTESIRSIAGEKPEILVFLYTGEYCQQCMEQD